MRPDEVIAAFAAAWNITDDGERPRLLTACCRPDVVFAAPQGQVTGIDALGASIGEFRVAFPAAQVAFGVPDQRTSETGRTEWPVLSGVHTSPKAN